jgi:GH25 family lysozyme M1 (1,4-beta-N-acetylmuramidase)
MVRLRRVDLVLIRRDAIVASVFIALVVGLLPLAAPALAQDYTLGIDASHHQGDINWNRVAESGHVFAFYKATEGATFTDNTYAANRVEAADASIPFGAYHFARPQGGTIAAAQADAVSEAQHFLDVAQPAPGDLLPVLDMEAAGGLGANRLIAWTQAWLDEIAAALDVRPLIYSGPSFWQTNMADTTTFAEQGFPLWIAHYTSASAPRTPANNWNGNGWAFWQWTNCATVPGIAGCVDEDRFSGSDLSPYTIPGAPEPEPTPDPATPPSNDSPPVISGETEVGETLSASTGTWSGSQPLSYSYSWQRCAEDGSGCSAVLNGTDPDYRLDPADYGHRMKVTVTATNSAGSSAQESSLSEVVTDTTAPVAPRVIRPRREVTLKTRLNVEWARAEALARYDMRYRVASKRGRFGEYRQPVTGSDETSSRINARRGSTYCFAARATDTAGNQSAWSNERCTTVPLDDRDLRRSSGWKRKSGGAFYLGTAMKTRRRGVSLLARNVGAREIHLVAQRCPRCGKVLVRFDGRRVGTVNLRANRRINMQVMLVARFRSLRRGDLELVTVTRGPVSIDGLALSTR